MDLDIYFIDGDIMDYIVNAVFMMLLAFTTSVLLGLILISILKRVKVSRIINVYLERHSNKKLWFLIIITGFNICRKIDNLY